MIPSAHFWVPLPHRLATSAPTLAIPPSPSAWAQSLHFPAEPTQIEILNSAARRLLLLCSRQYGKTTLIALKAGYFALTHPNALIIVVSTCQALSAEFIRLVRGALHAAGVAYAPDSIHRYSAVLDNKARILGLPCTSDTIRGYAADLVIVDEAAFVPDPVFEALTPSLANTNGALWCLSSAGDQNGFFYREFRHAKTPYTRFEVPATKCPRFSQQYLDEERLRHGEIKFNREYMCQFSPIGATAIPLDVILGAATSDFEAWNDGQPLWPFTQFRSNS